MKKIGLAILLGLALAFVTYGLCWAGPYYIVTGTNQFKPTDTQSYPSLLDSYVDVYGTTVRRMTTEAGSVRPNYTARTSTIENSDGTLFAVNSYIRAGSSWEIFTTNDGIYRATLKAFLYGASDYDHFVWSNTTPNVGYLFVASRYGYAYDSYPAKFYKITINVSTWVVSGELLYIYAREDMPTCPEPNTLFWVKNHDEGPPSWDGRYWASTLHCSNSKSENYPYALLLTDRDLGGSESPGVKGYVILPQGYASNAGVSPGGNYFFWKEYGTTSCGSGIYCVKFFPVACVSGNTNYTCATRLSRQNAGSHFNVQYDDLGNEIYVSGLSGSGIVYWRFNTAPSSAIIMAPWSYTRATGAKVGDTHSIVAGVKEGPRSWVVVLTTDGNYPECGGKILVTPQ